ncbi:hypothetical protein V493_04233 [Pseudogymnoascus sp. VKM F-4281 (FW-2241)]|nr:hypothetical protein V493_04233 [Pseudogymnoascus sp. VKM F-4281 (FW-2241)]
MGEGPARAVRAAAAYKAIKRPRSLAVAQWFAEPEGAGVVIRPARRYSLQLATGATDDVELLGDGTYPAVVLVAAAAAQAAVAAERLAVSEIQKLTTHPVGDADQLREPGLVG